MKNPKCSKCDQESHAMLSENEDGEGGIFYCKKHFKEIIKSFPEEERWK